MLQFLHSDEVQEMFSDFGFFPPPSKVVDLNLRGIDELILPPGTETWAFESPDKTIVGGGADRFVFSGKRHSFTRYQVPLARLPPFCSRKLLPLPHSTFMS